VRPRKGGLKYPKRIAGNSRRTRARIAATPSGVPPLSGRAACQYHAGSRLRLRHWMRSGRTSRRALGEPATQPGRPSLGKDEVVEREELPRRLTARMLDVVETDPGVYRREGFGGRC
jgi:hypothetical protein